MTPRPLLLLLPVLALACERPLSADTVRLEQLPADITTGPALVAAQTKAGHIYAAPNSGGLLRLSADGGAWDVLSEPPITRTFIDFKDGKVLAARSQSDTLYEASPDGFVPVQPALPVPGHAAFAGVGTYALKGRDRNGVYWGSFAAAFGQLDGRAFVAHLDPGAGETDWTYDELPLGDLRQTIPVQHATLTAEGRLFFRPYDSGVWELDLATRAVVERVTCAHELFRPSHQDYTACQEDLTLAAGPDGSLFMMNGNEELWRLAPGAPEPTLAVKGTLPQLVLQDAAGLNNSMPGGPRLYVDPKGRVWLCFRWGDNSADDTSWLYVAEPDRSDAWTFLKGDLPRNTSMFGAANTPLLSNGSLDTGLLLFRVVE